MRAITLCPACQTQFFVTAEQLEKHHGKVRCGECAQVFDATQHLIERDADSSAEPNDEIVVEPTLTDVGLNSVTQEVNPTEITTTGSPETLGDYVPSGKKSWFSSNRNAHHSKWLRYTISFICIVLGLTAALQAIYAYRSSIAAVYPVTTPYLKALCAPLNCKIALPKNIALIVIDDSDIQEDADFAGALRFTSTLKNQANYSQAYPNIELTLTDMNDQALLRRTLKPIDYLPKSLNVKDGFASGETVTINLALVAKEVVVSGYRVAITY